MSRILPRSAAFLSRILLPQKFSRIVVSSRENDEGQGVLTGFPLWRIDYHRFHSLGCGGTRLRAGGYPAMNCDDPDYDPTEARSPPSEKLIRLVDEIASLTLLEVSDLTTLLKKKLGLRDMPMMPMGFGAMGAQAMQGGAAAAPVVEEKAPEKTIFDVKLDKYDSAAKIKIIKEVRTFTALGLKEAKELVEKVPALLKKGVTKEEATQIIEKIKAVGGTAVME